jgi:hypothetical protein
MKKTPDLNTTQDQNQAGDQPAVDRREFLTGSVGIGAAVLGAGALAGASTALAQDMVIPTPDWKTLKPGALDPDVVWAEIGMRGRSMLEIMQVASKAVQAPPKDVERGVVSANQSPAQRSVDDATDWLVIMSSDSEPSDTTLSIRYRGHWFYIDDADLQSRETFSMLNALYAVVGGTVPGAHPVLTLPVN